VSRFRRLRRAASADQGFTIIELLMTMVLLGIIVGPLATMIAYVDSSSHDTMTQDSYLSQARAAVEQIASDVREGYSSSATMTAVSSLSGTQITFYAPDTATPFHLRQISYRLSGGNLQRAYATSSNTQGPPWTIPALGSWVTMLSSVTNATVFTYQDDNGATTSTPSAVSRVLITVTVTPPGGGPPTTYSDSATIRANS
jgi:prepilin-type N-terminal cleavage/methylation domain-containing protein